MKKKRKTVTDPSPPRTRIIMFTGKGGVGKTSVAAATAVRAAEMGLGTLIMSTDAAHSLGDSFDLPIGHTPTGIRENLWGQEIDVNKQISKNWGPIHDFFTRFLHHRGFDSIIADELAILPGMEEIFSLLEVKEHAVDERFQVLVIDCAPTADTARLLALPDIARWYMEKIFRIERAVVKTIRPVAERIFDTPLPTDDVFAGMERLYHQILAVKKLLTDRTVTSIRMVLNPEKMVIKEAQRAFTFLSLFDFGIDAVVVNRLLPPGIKDPYYGKWREIQTKHMELINESFQPLPILTARLWDQDIGRIQIPINLAGQTGEEL
ncbi:MAG: ArsA family ATPase [Thermodesulfobacteriota bacterium]|nr:ArsA family ATPase [Thermodesulfobacteriota bacterium]